MGKKITTENFIKELKEKWGCKYDFSKVNYVDAKTKVCIICPEHGEFWTLPQVIRKCGCRKCFIENKTKTREQFIDDARKVHGNKYDYSKVEYVNAHTKVCIICPEHGEFWQKPNTHLSGNGCKKCGTIDRARKNKKSTEEWINDARKVHGNKYDYSKVEYINNRTKVCIICPEHGEFWQTPYSHLSGIGCPKCGYNLLSINRRLSTEEWIEKARKIHGDKYDYSKSIYYGYYKPITIICKEHGEFTQLAYDHLHGKGCKKCKMSHLENRINNLLTTNNINFEYNIKFPFLKHGKGQFSLDFYIKKYNIAIECQGIQHFTDTKFFKKTFNEAYDRDLRKYNDCKNNGIRILYFSNYITDNYIDKVFNYEQDILKEIEKYEKGLL